MGHSEHSNSLDLATKVPQKAGAGKITWPKLTVTSRLCHRGSSEHSGISSICPLVISLISAVVCECVLSSALYRDQPVSQYATSSDVCVPLQMPQSQTFQVQLLFCPRESVLPLNEQTSCAVFSLGCVCVVLNNNVNHFSYVTNLGTDMFHKNNNWG